MSNSISKKIISHAPGRVCLFGDHQDYLGLPIIACAIDRGINIHGEKDNSNFIKIELPQINTSRKININQSYKVDNGDLFLLALKVLRRYGCIPNHGLDLRVEGNLPINSGLSSSSALIIAWINLLIEYFGIDRPVTPELVAQIAYEAEVVEMNSSGGKMDQYTISLGQIIYLETDESSKFEILNFPELNLVVGDSGLPKATHTVLKELKSGALSAINSIKKNIPDFEISKVLKSEIDSYMRYVPKQFQNYFRAAVLNHEITKQAYIEFQQKTTDLTQIGNLMTEHHLVLKNLLNLTAERIDNMVDAAMKNGALGCKIVGSGKGGCIVAICTEENEKGIQEAMKNAGAKDAFKCVVSKGAEIVKT
ncbi:MAG: galactokinase family protein [Flavobacteriaceae bacterium]|nr:galactokinase family protein [Flavobacteriaceae bacterium]